jgi:L-gulonate 3-dehydrogenase
MKVAVIGTGLVGAGWAIAFARGGCDVALWDAKPDAVYHAMEYITVQLEQLESLGLVADVGDIQRRLTVCKDLGDAISDVAYVQESLPEKIEIKREIFSKLDSIASQTAVLASSTSGFPASAFTEELAGRHRCIVAHPANPPYLLPVVELCGAPWTSGETVSTARAFMRQIGQHPVVIHRELSGFVLNRLQGALLREAFRLVEQGYIDIEGIDITVREGLGLRWSIMGPFETIDLNAPGGVSDYCERYGQMYQSFRSDIPEGGLWSTTLVRTVEEARRKLLALEQLADRRAWRDRRLMLLVSQKRKSEPIS